MNSIQYIQLSEQNFSPNALDHFIRHQEVNFSLQYVNHVPTFVETNVVEDWSLSQRREIVGAIRNYIAAHEGFAFGAVSGNEVIGYILVTTPFFGSQKQYIELKMFHVSAPYRNHGIGRTLFQLACAGARRIGANRLYIEAHPAKETQLAYRKFGCTDITESIPLREKKDNTVIQMEYQL